MGLAVVSAGFQVVRMVVELLQEGNVDRVGHVVIEGLGVVVVEPPPPDTNMGG